MEKQCSKCRRVPPLEEFRRDKRWPNTWQSWCKSCHQEHNKRKRPYLLPRYRKWRRAHEQKNKLDTLWFYSGGEPKCFCCGEKETTFLTIDHINGGGKTHRKQMGRGGQQIYRWLKRNNYPEGFRILCFNCNSGQFINGGVCPHRIQQRNSLLITH